MSIPQFFKDDPFLTPKDIMEIIGRKEGEKDGLARATVYNKIRFEMRHYRFGKRYAVRLSDFQKWLEKQAIGPTHD